MLSTKNCLMTELKRFKLNLKKPESAHKFRKPKAMVLIRRKFQRLPAMKNVRLTEKLRFG